MPPKRAAKSKAAAEKKTEAAPKVPKAKAAPKGKRKAAEADPKPEVDTKADVDAKPEKAPATEPAPEVKKAKTSASSSLPSVQDSEIVAWVGMNSFLSGVEYYEQKKIKDLEVSEEKKTVQGKCKGQAEYTIDLTFSDTGLSASKCTCPLGVEDKKCKHVACALLLWQEKCTGEKKVRSKRNPTEEKAIKAKVQELRDMKVPELKSILKANDQSTTGAKEDLLERVADGMCFGALPRCPKCSGGKLRYRQGAFYCPGYMEDDTFLECEFFSEDVKRNEWAKP